MTCLPIGIWRKPEDKNYRMDAYAYYNAAVMKKEQGHVPIIGPSIDRRMLTLLNKLANSDTLQSAVCFVCAQLHTWVQAWTQMHGEAWPNYKSQSPIRWLKVRDSLLAWENLDTEMFLETFDVTRFKKNFAADGDSYDNPFCNASELRVGDPEWQRKLFIPHKNVAM